MCGCATYITIVYMDKPALPPQQNYSGCIAKKMEMAQAKQTKERKKGKVYTF